MAQAARRKPQPQVEIPRREWPVAAVAGIGLGISAYLTLTKAAGHTALFCTAGSGCDVVQASRYATFLGLPTATWGVGLYALVIALAVVGLTAKRWFWTFLCAVVAVAFSAHLTYLSFFEIHAACPWCLTDAGVAVALLVVLLVRRPTGTGRRAVARPARLATWGVVTAVATVVFAAGVWVTGAPSGSAPYQEALARHLTATGAVFYGAYW